MLGIVCILFVAAIFFIFFNNKNAPLIKENLMRSLGLVSSNSIDANNIDNDIYTNSKYGFSFQYPNDFTVTDFSEAENSDTILVRKKEGKDSFQIFISS